MKDIKIRAISGSLYAASLIGAIFFSPYAMTAVIFIFSGLALWEFQRLIQFKSIIPFFFLSTFNGVFLIWNGNKTNRRHDALHCIDSQYNSYHNPLFFKKNKLQLSNKTHS